MLKDFQEKIILFNSDINPLELAVSLELRLDELEDRIKEKDSEIAALKESLQQMRQENEIVKIVLTKAITEIPKAVLAEATEILVKTFNEKQDEIDKSTSKQFDAIYRDLLTLSNELRPFPPDVAQPSSNFSLVAFVNSSCRNIEPPTMKKSIRTKR